MSQWYVVGLGLGLLTLSIGGVWVGILAPLVVWALGLGGIVSIRPIPRSAAMKSSLLVGFCFSVLIGFAVTRLMV